MNLNEVIRFSSSNNSNYVFESDTQKCDEKKKDSIENAGVRCEPSFCDSDIIEVELSSFPVIPDNINMYPYVLLNFTAKVKVASSRLFLRLECIEAPNLEDDYCHNHEEQFRKWGRMIWPCRALTIIQPNLTTLPFYFTYSCFRLFAYSQYRISVFLFPQNCVSKFVVTIPDETHVHHSIGEFYGTDVQKWSPLIFVELTSADGVTIRYVGSTLAEKNKIKVTLYQQIDSLMNFRYTDSIDPNVKSFKWRYLAAGNYTAYAYVEKNGCDFFCDFNFIASANCSPCPSTYIKFTVTNENYIAGHPLIRHKKLMLYTAEISLFILIVMLLTLIAVLAKRGGQQHLVVDESISILKTPKVLILYSDDCTLHSDCILSLAHFLIRCSKCDVHIDQIDLEVSDIAPMHWFFKTYAEVNKVLFLFSEGANSILQGRQLVQQQPYPDFFSTALNRMISEMRESFVFEESITLLRDPSSRFIFLHMSYSLASVIPLSLSSLPILTLELPTQMRELVYWIHGISFQQFGDISDAQIDMTEIELAVEKVRQYRSNNGSWLTKRIKIEPFQSRTNLPEAIPLQEVQRLLTEDEQFSVAEKFNLEPPGSVLMIENELDSDSVKRFALIGSPDELSDSDDCNSDHVLLEHLLMIRE